MSGKAAVIAGSAVLAIIAAVVVVGATLERPGMPEKVTCVVCGMDALPEDMMLETIDSIGLAPDHMPVWVDSEECAWAVRRNPEMYRDKAIRELENRRPE